MTAQIPGTPAGQWGQGGEPFDLKPEPPSEACQTCALPEAGRTVVLTPGGFKHMECWQADLRAEGFETIKPSTDPARTPANRVDDAIRRLVADLRDMEAVGLLPGLGVVSIEITIGRIMRVRAVDFAEPTPEVPA